MMTAFKILMIVCSVISFIGSVGEKIPGKQRVQVAAFASAGVLFLLAEAVTNFIH